MRPRLSTKLFPVSRQGGCNFFFKLECTRGGGGSNFIFLFISNMKKKESQSAFLAHSSGGQETTFI